jgi:hypothetical protein
MSDEDQPVGAVGAAGGPGVPTAPEPSGRPEASAPFATTNDDETVAVGPPPVPADPAAYDSERSAAARKRGLSTPYVPGGRDPDLAKTEHDERRLLRWLVIMVVVIVLAGFVLGMAAALLGLNGLVGIPD